MKMIMKFLAKLKLIHTSVFIIGIIVIVFLLINAKNSRLEHLENGGVLACGAEEKTEVIDEGYSVSGSGLAILSKTGKKWSIRKCTPFAPRDKKQ